MSLISADIPNLINGVSQQPPSLRLPTQAEFQLNGLSSVVEGLTKRPPTEHIKTLLERTDPDLHNTSDPFEDAFYHTIRRDENEFYILVITYDEMFVFDQYGVRKNITRSSNYATPGSFSASLSGFVPKNDLAAVTVADYTFILNKMIRPTISSATSSARNPEALVYVKQGDYRTKYTVKVTKGGNTYTRSIETMASTQDTTTLTSDAERSVQTDRIAANLDYTSATETTYYGSSPAGTIPGMTITQYGSVLHYEATDGQDFTINAEDSRGNTFLLAFKGQTADFDDLPPSGPDGFVIGVVGDNDKGQDDYYVELQTNANGGYVYKETIAPNIETSLNAGNMPHKLVRLANGHFEFDEVDYADRKVGDDTTNPFPSFASRFADPNPPTISDIFFHRNRLGLLAGENVIFSEAGEFQEFNFFQRTTLTVLDSDPIDVAVSNNKVSILKHAVPFNESLLLFSDLTQFRLDATDLLTPETVSIDVTTQFEASLNAKPVGAGRYVYFGTRKGTYSGIREYFVDLDAEVDDAADITAHVPTYIKGTISKLQASSNEDILLVQTVENPEKIYVYKYYWQGNEKLQSSWSEWTFSGKIRSATFDNSEIVLCVEYDDSLSLERLNLSVNSAEEITTSNHNVHLDRRRLYRTPSFFQGDLTELTDLVQNEGFLCVTKDGSIIPITEVYDYLNEGYTQGQGFGDNAIFIGKPYEFRYQFSPQLLRSDKNVISTGRLQLRNWTVLFNNTAYFEAHVTPSNRATSINKFTGRVLGKSSNKLNQVAVSDGSFRFPILTNANDVTIELYSDSYKPCKFTSAEWEGFFVMRSRRL